MRGNPLLPGLYMRFVRLTRSVSGSRQRISWQEPLLFFDLPMRVRMTRQEILDRLQSIRDKGNEALRLLETNPLSPEAKTEIQSLTRSIKQELQAEYTRMLPERVQKTLTIFEKSLYSPTIEEAWKDTGIGRLKAEGTPDQKWRKPLEAVVYKAGLYLS
jgi:hypothetical protein